MNKIYVGNLSFDVTEQELEGLFGQYGQVVEIALIRDKISNRLKGFGFITFSSSDEAKKALEMDGKEFLSRPLRVNIANERQDSRGGDRKKTRRW